jgi:hypothetical protein
VTLGSIDSGAYLPVDYAKELIGDTSSDYL